MILAAVYNFHLFGFILALICLLSSVVEFVLIRISLKEVEKSKDDKDIKPIKSRKCQVVLWVLYLVLVVLIGLFALARLLSLVMRASWRDDLDGKFPEACGDWAADMGCTRVTLEKAGCTRPEEIVDENSLVFPISTESSKQP